MVHSSIGRLNTKNLITKKPKFIMKFLQNLQLQAVPRENVLREI